MRQNVEIIMLGDSLTSKANWKELLNHDNILNLGMNGDTTKDILNRIDTVIEIKPKVVFLMAGINDMSYSINIEEIFKNYTDILEILLLHKIKVIVQLTLYTTMLPFNKKVTCLNKMLIEYCNKNMIEYIDLNHSFCDENNTLKQELTTDGLHLGLKAYKAWAYKINQLPFF